MQHDQRVFNSPLCIEHARSLLSVLDPQDAFTALDVGCARGELLALWMELGGGRCFGVDPDRSETALARRRLARFADRVRLQTAPIAEAELPGAFDVAMCLGATHAFGGVGDALRATYVALAELLRPGGRMLIGHGFWKQTPAPEYLAATGIDPAELCSHAENLELGESLGLRTLYVSASSTSEWDAFEAGSGLAAERRLDLQPDDPEAQALAERRRAWRRASLRWGRDTMGFGFYVFETPRS
ncbi:MAG: SAM-dependent methyltransferase [Planctomycetota bacterium]|nr:MAG: SAM-dependent methyltransferase [Planctomycetota bacterium]